MLVSVLAQADPVLYAGLLSGQYVRYGTVIRHAANTPQAGQIVRHLQDVFPDALSTSLRGLGGGPLGVGASLADASVGVANYHS